MFLLDLAISWEHLLNVYWDKKVSFLKQELPLKDINGIWISELFKIMKSNRVNLMNTQKGLAPILIVILIAIIVLIITKFFYINVTPKGGYGASAYKNLFGQKFVCDVVPPSMSSNSCFNYFCIFGGCFAANP